MSEHEFFAGHRARLLSELREREACGLVFAARTRLRNGDSEHRYRPDSDFWYLTGLSEPDAALLLLPGACADDEPESILFLRPRDPDAELWTGRRLGLDAAVERLGVDAAHAIDELPEWLPDLLVGYPRLMVDLDVDEDRDRQVLALLRELNAVGRAGRRVPREILDPAPILHELRLRKDAGELARMRSAAAITTEAHLAVLGAVRPGMREYELDALLEYTFRRRGATGAAYTPIVAGGSNACILHYTDHAAELRAGDLVLVDAGAEHDYYASDVTRTFPVDGRFRPAQRELYELCLRAQLAALDAVRVGARFDAPHRAARAVIVAGLVELGLLEGPPDQALEHGSWRRFFPHRTSHWLGLDVHDCGAHGLDGEPRPLEPGMVLTVEPGIYVAADDDSVDARWRGIGIRIEDDVVVTAGEPEILTSGIPKSVEELEACIGVPGVPSRSNPSTIRSADR